MLDKTIRVKISEYKVAGPDSQLKIAGLGSCLALALYDPENKVGGLAHILLPGPAPQNNDGSRGAFNSTKYADRAIEALVKEMISAGAQKKSIVAKLAGGSNMFSTTDDTFESAPVKAGVGERNVKSVKSLLEAAGINVAAENVGGKNGRTVIFNPRTGSLQVSKTRGETTEI